MNKKLSIVAAAFALVVGVASLAVPTFAQNNNGGNDPDWKDWHDNKSRTITLKQVGLEPATEPTVVGQSYVLTEDAYDQNKKIGHDAVVCTAVRIITGGSEFLCDGALSIDGKGELQVQGLYTSGEKQFAASVVGGDGKFKFAHGELKVNVVSDTERTVKFDFN